MKIWLILFLILTASLATRAQTNNSPYSILGIGDIEDSYFNRTSGLANTGIAYRSNINLINNNPASFSALEKQFFVGEIGIRGTFIQYYGTPVDPLNNTSFEITFRRFAIGTKITKHWGSSAGLVPFSSENYEFNSFQPVLGTIGVTTSANSSGYGGINRAYWANAYEFFNHLSLGIDASYLFGSTNQKTILQNTTSYISTNTNTNFNSFYFNYGLQYYAKIGKKWDFALGATFANRTELNPQFSVIILAIDSSQLYNQPQAPINYLMPVTYNLGVSVTRNKKYTLLADYKYQGWSSLNYSGFNYALQDSRRYSIGFEISKKKSAYNTLYETSYFQTGVYYSNSYVNVYGQPIMDMGATIGFGINSKRTPLSYAVSLQYGVKGSESHGLVQERYASLTIMVSYRDIWYTRGKRFD